jgi:hypothetical protein
LYKKDKRKYIEYDWDCYITQFNIIGKNEESVLFKLKKSNVDINKYISRKKLLLSMDMKKRFFKKLL